MRPRVFGALGVAAAITFVAVGLLGPTDSQQSFESANDAPLFPQLADRIDDIGKIIVDRMDGGITLERRGEDWTVVSHDDFPAEISKVEGNLSDFAALRLVEPKTKRKESFPKLEVEDPDAEGARSRRMELLDREGKALASVIIGKTKANIVGLGRPGVYLRRDNEDQAWLAAGKISTSTELADWVDTNLFGIGAEEVEILDVKRAGLDSLRLVRGAGADGAYRLEGVPEGFDAKPELQLRRIVGEYADIQFDKVRQRGSNNPNTATTLLSGAGGLEYTVETYKEGEDRWVRVDVTGSGDAAARAETLNRRLADREFRVSGRHAENVVLSIGDLIALSAEG